KRMTSSAALLGMLTGAIVVFGWKSWTPIGSELHQLYEMIPGFTLASLVIITTSLLSAKPEAQIVDTFEQAQKAYKNAL
ncbi:hypothetical protein I142_01337, partial [Pasteurella multocida RIIF]